MIKILTNLIQKISGSSAEPEKAADPIVVELPQEKIEPPVETAASFDDWKRENPEDWKRSVQVAADVAKDLAPPDKDVWSQPGQTGGNIAINDQRTEGRNR